MLDEVLKYRLEIKVKQTLLTMQHLVDHNYKVYEQICLAVINSN